MGKPEECSSDDDVLLSSVKEKKTTPSRSSRKMVKSKVLPTLEEGQMLDTTVAMETSKNTPTKTSRRCLRSSDTEDSGVEETEVVSRSGSRRLRTPNKRL